MKQLDPKATWLFFINSIGNAFLLFLPLIFMGVMLLISLNKGNREYTFNPGGTTPAEQFYDRYSSGIIDWFWIVIVIFIVISFIWAKLTNYFYKYELTDLGFKKELGVIYKQYVTIPYDRIQNVDIYRGIWARILGLSDLNIQTAGSGTVVITGEGRLPGLSKETAEALRDELVKRSLESRRGQGL